MNPELWTQPRRVVQPASRPLTKRTRTLWLAPGALWYFRTRREALRWMRANWRETKRRFEANGWIYDRPSP